MPIDPFKSSTVRRRFGRLRNPNCWTVCGLLENSSIRSKLLLHASIITVLWVYRFTVHRRHAMMVSMLASSILTVVLATLVASGGMASSPLYGLAFMQLGFAFFHPAVLASTTETE
jgi:hypothetical protein